MLVNSCNHDWAIKYMQRGGARAASVDQGRVIGLARRATLSHGGTNLSGGAPMTPERKLPQMPKWLALAALVAIAIAASVMFGDQLSLEALRDNREALLAYVDAQYVPAAAAFVALYALMVAFSVPGATVATLAGGFLFGLFPGVLFNVAGATTGAVALFLAARWGLGAQLAAKMQASDGRIGRIKAGIDRNQWSMLFLIRLLPVVPFFVANLLPALVGAGLWPYVVTTSLGILPGTFVYTSIGAGLGAVFAEGGDIDLSLLAMPAVLIPILGLAALAALPLILRAFGRGKDI